MVLSTNILWTEYRYRDIVSNELLFLASYIDRFVCVILTGLVFRLLLDADPKHAKILEFVSKFMSEMSRDHVSTPRVTTVHGAVLIELTPLPDTPTGMLAEHTRPSQPTRVLIRSENVSLGFSWRQN